MRRTIRTAFLSLLCAGALAHVMADKWEVLDEDAGWSNVFYNAPYQPLDSLEPISVVMTGEKDADGYPIGDIYYNEGERCRLAVEDKFRYYTTLVYGVRGIGYGISTGGSNPVVLFTHPLTNTKTGAFDYGWLGEKMTQTPIQYLDMSKITFSGKCGRRKIGTFKEVLKIAKDKSYYRARLTIDRQLWSDGLLTGDDVNNGYPIWTPHYDSVRLGRAYYYLYLSEPMVQRGYSCVGANCPTKKGTYYYDENNPVYSFTFDVGVQFYAWTKFQMQYRPWVYDYNERKFVPSYWRNVRGYENYKQCLTYEYQDEYKYNPRYADCDIGYYTSFSASAKRAEIVTEGDSLVEYRLAGITRIVEGPSKDGAHAMQIYDTTYSDIIKLVPKYKLHVDNGNYGGGYFYGDRNCGGQEVAGTKCSYEIASNYGYDFKCWSKTEENPKCISTENPLNLTVRHDTTLYAIYEDSPLEVSMRADSSTEVKYNNQYKAYSHVLGRDSLYFYGYVSGAKKDGYFTCEYNDGTNGWQRLGSVKNVPADHLAHIRHVALRINKTGEARCVYNGVDTLGTKKFSKATETKFRFALSYNSDFSASVYSEVKTVRWLHPIAFYDVNKNLILDTAQVYGSTVKFPTDKKLIKIPAESEGYHYDYYWADQNWKKYGSDIKSITLDMDSLLVHSWLIEWLDVKFVDFDGKVLKDTIVHPQGFSVAPSVPNHEGLYFKGWDIKYTARNSIHEETYDAKWDDPNSELYDIWNPVIATALYDTLYTVRFVDRVGYSVLKSEELVYGDSPTKAPAVPSHKGLVFEDWDIDWTKITRPLDDSSRLVMVNTIYDIPKKTKFAFTVTDFDFGSKAEDIKVGVPNKCFEVSKKIYRDGSKPKRVDSVEEWENHHVELTVSVTCSDDSLGNIWKYLPYGSEREGKMFVTLNGENVAVSANSVLYYYIFPVTFADYDGTVLKQEFVPLGKSATAPKDPVRKGYVFDGWDTDYSDVDSSLTVTAQYKKEASSSASAKSSSSSTREVK